MLFQCIIAISMLDAQLYMTLVASGKNLIAGQTENHDSRPYAGRRVVKHSQTPSFGPPPADWKLVLVWEFS
jgi:hypothetical protein